MHLLVFYSLMFKVSPASLRHLLTLRTVFSKTVFSVARSTFRVYSVMAIFKSSIVWGLYVLWSSGAQRRFDHPVLLLNIYLFFDVTSCRPVNSYWRFGRLVVPLSWSPFIVVFSDCLNLKLKASRFCEIWGIICVSARRNILEDWNVQQHLCDLAQYRCCCWENNFPPNYW
jgi:hypothetical protein